MVKRSYERVGLGLLKLGAPKALVLADDCLVAVANTNVMLVGNYLAC